MCREWQKRKKETKSERYAGTGALQANVLVHVHDTVKFGLPKPSPTVLPGTHCSPNANPLRSTHARAAQDSPAAPPKAPIGGGDELTQERGPNKHYMSPS